MTTSVILNAVFAVLIVGALAAVCAAAYFVAAERKLLIAMPHPEEERLAA